MLDETSLARASDRCCSRWSSSSPLAAFAIDVSPLGALAPVRSLYAGPYVQVGSTLVAYRRWGARGTPIVLLGGAAEPTWVWHSVGPRLAAAGHRVFALDLPPFGYTQRNVQPSLDGWLPLLRGFERRLAIRRPLLVGHSLGAGVAAAEALDRPGEIAGIVLLDGDALPFGGGRSWLAHALAYPWFDAAFRSGDELGLARGPCRSQRLGAECAEAVARDAAAVRTAVPGARYGGVVDARSSRADCRVSRSTA